MKFPYVPLIFANSKIRALARTLLYLHPRVQIEVELSQWLNEGISQCSGLKIPNEIAGLRNLQVARKLYL